MLIHLVHGRAGQSTWGAGRREGPGCRMAEPGFGPLPACLLPVSFFPAGPYHTGWDMLGTEGDCRGRARGQTAQVRSWLLRASLCDVGQVTSSTRSLFSSSIYKTEAGAAASQRRTPLPRRAAGPALGTEWPLAEHTLLPVSRLHCMRGVELCGSGGLGVVSHGGKPRGRRPRMGELRPILCSHRPLRFSFFFHLHKHDICMGTSTTSLVTSRSGAVIIS